MIAKQDCTALQLARAVKQQPGLLLATANGVTRAEYKVPVQVPSLGEIWCWLMISSPKVLSMKRLIKENEARIEWTQEEICKMEMPSKTHYLPVVHGVPALKA